MIPLLIQQSCYTLFSSFFPPPLSSDFLKINCTFWFFFFFFGQTCTVYVLLFYLQTHSHFGLSYKITSVKCSVSGKIWTKLSSYFLAGWNSSSPRFFRNTTYLQYSLNTGTFQIFSRALISESQLGCTQFGLHFLSFSFLKMLLYYGLILLCWEGWSWSNSTIFVSCLIFSLRGTVHFPLYL